ncbi:MAG: Kef family K(+) transporter [Alphaproteobacteria bacterium]|nr:Kef family K(+) transporter [Alphaproteobacteria bacterium]
MHYGPLITMLVGGLGLAFLFGALAHRFRISPVAGYLLAGVAVGPFTPGFVADQAIANQLADLGVILLMFGVGLHFSMRDLLSVRRIAVPGSLALMAASGALGFALSTALDFSLAEGAIFGLALAVSSTVVMLRTLQDSHLLETEDGRIAVGWLIVEDLVMILALVLIPALVGRGVGGGVGETNFWLALGQTMGKLVAFVAVMWIVGRRVVPWVLHWVAHTGSRELFRLSVLAIALVVAFAAAALFGASFALGAFFAGMILAESPLSQRAAEESLPLRDAFAVLFFVSVGMLFDPAIVLRAPIELLAALAIVIVGKFVLSDLLLRAFGRSRAVSLSVSASRAQIGEFSFVLVGLGATLGLVSGPARDLILAAAIISIFVNPALFALVRRGVKGSDTVPIIPPEAVMTASVPASAAATDMTDHSVIVGYGRVGGLVGAALRAAGEPVFVIESGAEGAKAAHKVGATVAEGNAADPEVLAASGIARAKRLFVAIPNSFEAGQVVQQARAQRPDLEIVARAHSDTEVAYLRQCGADRIVMGEAEIARRMLAFARGEAEG